MDVSTRLGFNDKDSGEAKTVQGLDEVELNSVSSLGTRRFQVLVLDGGGYRGMFSAASLACLEEDLGTGFVDHFDLVVGTSTGGIIALALGLGLHPAELVDFYLEWGDRIFAHPRIRQLRQLVRPKYNAGHLREALIAVFGDRLLGDSGKRLCIPSYDLLRDDVHLFRTPHHVDLVRDWKTPMVDVGLATTAAPTYFPAHELDGYRLIDGGVWANTPIPTAINEAVNRFGIELADIRILSIGTTSATRDRPMRLDSGGLLRWSTQATDVLLQAQATAAVNTMRLMLPSKHWHRLDPKVPTRLGRLDHVDAPTFMGYAAGETRQQVKVIEKKFLDHTPTPYFPLNSETGSLTL